MSTPFAAMPTAQRWILLAALTTATVVLAIALWRQGGPLRTLVAPRGILSFEFAWTRERAVSILASWDLETARHQVQLDFPFLLVYPALMSLVCAMLAGPATGGLASAGMFLSWLVLLATPLDAVENWALLQMINNGAREALAALSGAAASVKFALVFAFLGYVPAQLVAHIVRIARGG